MSDYEESDLRQHDEELGFLLTHEEPNAESEAGSEPEQSLVATIQGDLTSVSLIDIFQTITMAGMSGMLVVGSSMQTTAVYFKDGQIRVLPSLGAWCRRLSHRLVGSGLAKAKNVTAALLAYRREGGSLAQLFEVIGGVPQQDFLVVRDALDEDCLLELFAFRNGTCEFYRDSFYNREYEERLKHCKQFDTSQILLEVARRGDEWEIILEDLGDIHEIYMPTELGYAGGENELETKLFEYLDGTRPLSDVGGCLPYSLFAVAKTAQKLLREHKIERVSTVHLIGLARIEHTAHNPDQARHFLQLIRSVRKPEHPEEFRELSSLYNDLGMHRESADALVQCAEQTENHEAKKQILLEAREVDSLNRDVLEQLYQVLADECGGEMSEELEIISEQLTECYCHVGEYDRALGLVDQQVEQHPESIAHHSRRAGILVKMGRRREAIDSLQHLANGFRERKEKNLLIHTLQQLLKLNSSDSKVRSELRALKARIHPKIIKAAIVCLVLVSSASFGYRTISHWFALQRGEEEYERAQGLVDQGHWDRALVISAAIESNFEGEELGSRASDLTLRIRAKKRSIEMAKRREVTTKFNKAVSKAADAFDSKDYGKALVQYLAIVKTYGKDAEFRAKAKSTISTRFGIMLKNLRVELERLERFDFPKIEDLGAPSDRTEAKKRLDKIYSPDWHARVIGIVDAVNSNAKILKLPGLPKGLMKAVRTYKPLSDKALGLRDTIQKLIAADRYKSNLGEYLTEADRAFLQNDFRQSYELYGRLAREYKGNKELEERFNDEFVKLGKLLALMKTSKEANLEGNFKAASLAYLSMKKLFPSVEFHKLVTVPVRVESTPKGAAVWIDGKEVGKTPYVHLAYPGTAYQAEIRMRGFERAVIHLPKKTKKRVAAVLQLARDWERKTDGVVTHPLAEARARGLIVASDRMGKVYAWSSSNGELRFEKRYKDLSGDLGSPLVCGDSVLLPARDGKLRLLSLSDGKEVWERELEGPLLSPAIRSGSSIWVVNEAGTIFRVSESDGHVQASLELGSRAKRGLVRDAEGSVYCVDRNGGVHAFGKGGGKLWSRAVPEAGFVPPQPSDAGIVIASDDKSLRILDPDDGSVIRVIAVDDNARLPMAIRGNEAWLSSERRELLHLDLGTGKILGRTALPELPSAGPTLAGSILLAPVRKHGAIAFHPSLSREFCRLALGLSTETPLLSAGDARLYFASQNGELLSFRTTHIQR